MEATLSSTLPMFALVLALIFIVAALYASVGHGGGSGYLAVLSLLGMPAAKMAGTALVLNLFVAGISLLMFIRSRHFSGRLILPFLIGSVPAAVLGGWMPISARLYGLLLGGCLMIAAWRLAVNVSGSLERKRSTPSVSLRVGSGAAIGWISGAVGVGGGIFLSPMLLLLGWAPPHSVAAASACFVVVNSAAGLTGRALGGTLEGWPQWPLVVVALLGGIIGSRMGARCLSGRMLNWLLAVVLVVAAVKLFIKGLPS